ncbi:MAG: ATP-binding cassette domain-containing protein [Bacillota bacterium]|nr:ATP-binding cassette domain-containing protein [Bacillota bacterium]
MLEVKNLTIRAGDFQVRDISFSVQTGSCHVFLGPTGSGKTLILETVAGLRLPESGTIYLSGEEITSTLPEKRKIAYLPQDLALFPNMTVKDNISYSMRINGLDKKESYKRIKSLAQTLEIEGILDRSIHYLSGGEKQRAALARALASGSKMMLLDEPLSSLNTRLRRDIWYLLKKIQSEHGLTYLVVTHDLDEASFLGDTISIIFEGDQLQTGGKNSVFNHPTSIEAAGIVGVENYFKGVVEKIEENFIVIYSEEIGTAFKVEKDNSAFPLKEGAHITMGIRANNLFLAEPDNKSMDTNAAEFVVEAVYEKGSTYTVLLKHLYCKDSKALAEVFKHNNKLSFNIGQTVKVLFPGEYIMILS